MQTTFALAALAAVAYAAPQVTDDVSPSSAAPAGCSPDYAPGAFEITIINGSTVAKRDLSKRQASYTCGQDGYLTLKLAGGKLTDSKGRQGYIASNYQFQFDVTPQDGAIYTAGFSLCSNGSLALGGSNVFYECKSGDFYNLYDRSSAAQCEPILIDLIPCAGSSVSDPPAGPAQQQSDGQPTATGAAPVSQIGDGQPQGGTPAPVPVSEYHDGQPQVVSVMPAPVSQISDGQPQATAAGPPPVSQISDGQPQATGASPPPVSQISDGQPQATGASPPPVSQISDGQPQATGASPPPVSQISDGQPQATAASNATVSVSPPAQVTGSGGNIVNVASAGAAAFVGAVAVLLL